MSNMTSTHEMAKIFVARYGSEAALEVHRREQQARQAGQDTEAHNWHRVRQALEIVRGPRVT